MFKIKEYRLLTNLTQKEFAEKYQIPLSTLRKWEQNSSQPPKYFIHVFESQFSNIKEYKKYIGSDKKIYFVDEKNKKVGDSFGHWIYFDENLDGVIDSNLGLYIETLFLNYYKAVKQFNEDLSFDKKDRIRWR